MHRKNNGDVNSVRDDLDVDFYQTVYADLSGLSSRQAKRHWRRIGYRENRFPNMEAALAAAFQVGTIDFDPAEYLFLNEDLVPAGIDNKARAAVHFASVGHLEGRSYRLTSAGLGSLESLGTASTGPAIPSRRAWPTASSFHERSTDWNDPTDLASYVLGRPLDVDRAAIDGWLGPLDPVQRTKAILTCEEKLSPEVSFGAVTPEEFILFTYASVLGRAPSAADFDSLVTALDYGDVRREQLLLHRAAQGVHLWGTRHGVPEVQTRPIVSSEVAMQAHGVVAHGAAVGSENITSSDLSFLLLGTGKMVSRADWDYRVREVGSSASLTSALSEPAAESDRRNEFSSADDLPLITVLASIFRPGTFLRPFFQQIVNQTIFDQVELVCVLVQPSDEDLAIAREYEAAHPNILLQVAAERIGIYTAWNQAIEGSSGRFVTNANVDDLRRSDSLEVQARALLQHKWVDVVYQDVFYTLDSTLSWDEIEALGFRTDLPPVTPWTLLGMNSPHNAPMWRRTLHDDLGLFDDSFSSAGDYEFWLRCISADKVFFKIRDAHVAYYVNPNGLSTRPGGVGVTEALEIGRRYLPLLKYPEPHALLPSPDPAGPRYSRAERLTLSVCDQLMLLRSVQGS